MKTAIADRIASSVKGGVSLTAEDKLFFNSSAKKIKMKKNEFIMRSGETEHALYFVESGVLRYWVNDNRREEITFWFSLTNEFANAYHSMMNHIPCEFNIQAMTDCVVWKIDSEGFMTALNSSLTMNVMGRKILEDILTRKIKREIGLLKMKPEERYKEICTKSKELLQVVPLKHLASYLGVTPQSLSRIRRRIS